MLYVAHRLFALHDRILGARVARAVASVVGADEVFLPYCDTDEATLVAPVKGRRLFELDHERLDRIVGMLALMHGPSFDDGVCMEIGYAKRRGVPVVVLATDFQTYTLSGSSRQLSCPDPLIDAIVDDVIRAEEPTEPSAANTDRFATFSHRSHLALDHGIATAVDRLVELLDQPLDRPDRAAQSTATLPDNIFLEPSPYYGPDAARAWARDFERADLNTTAARRWSPPPNLPQHDPLDTAWGDWQGLLTSRTLIANTEGPETPPGAALLIGAALAQGSRIFVQHRSDGQTHAPGREPNFRNLMIQYSATRRFDSAADVLGLL